MININGKAALINNKAGATYEDPKRIFGNGLAAWYDFSDITTLYQSVGLVTPLTASGQAVASVLDKSGNGNTLFQNTASARPIYSTDLGIPRVIGDGVNDFLCCANYLSNATNTGRFSFHRKGIGDISTDTAWGINGTSIVTMNQFGNAVGYIGTAPVETFRFNFSGMYYKEGVAYKTYSNLSVNNNAIVTGLLRGANTGGSSTTNGNTYRFNISGGFVNNEYAGYGPFEAVEYVVVNGDITDLQVVKLYQYLRLKSRI